MLYTTLVHALPLLVERVAENAAPRLSNLLISNPFGFAGEAYLMGAKVELALPISVVRPGTSSTSPRSRSGRGCRSASWRCPQQCRTSTSWRA
jgi:hypothetical protein